LFTNPVQAAGFYFSSLQSDEDLKELVERLETTEAWLHIVTTSEAAAASAGT
jgi:hypothetical protein